MQLKQKCTHRSTQQVQAQTSMSKLSELYLLIISSTGLTCTFWFCHQWACPTWFFSATRTCFHLVTTCGWIAWFRLKPRMCRGYRLSWLTQKTSVSGRCVSVAQDGLLFHMRLRPPQNVVWGIWSQIRPECVLRSHTYLTPSTCDRITRQVKKTRWKQGQWPKLLTIAISKRCYHGYGPETKQPPFPVVFYSGEDVTFTCFHQLHETETFSSFWSHLLMRHVTVYCDVTVQ